MRLNDKKTIKKATCILTADWHLRDTQPKCRTDVYYETQFKKLTFIKDLQVQHSNCPVLIAGDVFDIPKPSPMLLTSTLYYLPYHIVCIPGQHDLPEHVLENFNQSGLAVIEQGSDCIVLKNNVDYIPSINNGKEIAGFPYGTQLKNVKQHIALIHTLIQEPQNTNKNIPYDYNCISIMKKLSDFKLIVSGDNHKPFVYKKGKQLIVNPGSIMRMDADQINHKPRVYLWYAKENIVEPVYLPIEKDVITRQHIEKKQEEDERIEVYKKRLKADIKIGISFEKNMKKYVHKNEIKKSVEKEIYTAMEGNKK